MKQLRKLLAFFFVYSEIWIAGVLYMRRWRFLPDWLPGFRVHQILRSDDDRALHDHPFSFVTFVLKGGYHEYLDDGSKTWHGAGSILYRSAPTLHRLELQTSTSVTTAGTTVTDIPAWTFVLRTRYFRQWGFQTKSGWVHNSKFIGKREGQNHHTDPGGQM